MIDKHEFLKDLKDMKRSCLGNPCYDPTNDIAYLITKHNLNGRILWKNIKEILYQQVP